MSEMHLRVYADRSELFRPDGTQDTFREGLTNEEAKKRYKQITHALEQGFLREQIDLCRKSPSELNFSCLTQQHTHLLDAVAGAITSEIGRALVGLTVMQLTIKAICPEQSVRLHKGGNSTKDFSWEEGISMRTLDKNFITPTLREYELLKLNRDGFMMTRSLAENYPYSKVYKAAIRGARVEWAEVVEAIDATEIDAKIALLYLISKLINRAEEFRNLADKAMEALQIKQKAGWLNDREAVVKLLKKHIDTSDYAARIMEIGMHALFQAMQEVEVFGSGVVKPLSQMRSANKKHGNIGDIELLEDNMIIEAWDAKYGKTYLRDELEELNDKLFNHPQITVAGFVTSDPLERVQEFEARRVNIENIYGLELVVLPLDAWVDKMFERAAQNSLVPENHLASLWITAYVESLALRRALAPIDEPCHQWLTSLKEILEQ